MWHLQAVAKRPELPLSAVVPDDDADIQATVKRLRARVGDSGFVFTSGGEWALRGCSGRTRS